MGQYNETSKNEKRQDASNCRVRSLGAGMEMCMVNAHCIYDLPYGNLCAHPLVSQMTEAGEISQAQEEGREEE